MIEDVNYIYPKLDIWYEASDGTRFRDRDLYMIHESSLQQKMMPKKQTAHWLEYTWWWIILGIAYLIHLL